MHKEKVSWVGWGITRFRMGIGASSELPRRTYWGQGRSAIGCLPRFWAAEEGHVVLGRRCVRRGHAHFKARLHGFCRSHRGNDGAASVSRPSQAGWSGLCHCLHRRGGDRPPASTRRAAPCRVKPLFALLGTPAEHNELKS